MCAAIQETEKKKVVIAIDSFKGSLSSIEAGNAAGEGVLKACPSAEVKICPLADGGEGTVEALVNGMGGEMQFLTVTGPLGVPVESSYGMIKESRTAVIEMASAAGITLVPKEQRNPLHTTTYGVGEMIRDAIGKGCRNFIIGIGGSSTNDGGMGMLQALGFSFRNKAGEEAGFGAAGLRDLAVISRENIVAELKECSFRVACDVTNPLCGNQGCSAIFGPQKGATPEMTEDMDQWLKKYAALAKKSVSRGRCNISGNRSSRWAGLCVSHLYQCSAGIRDSDCFRGDKTGRADSGCRFGDYGRRTSGWSDCHGESSGWSCKTG